MDPYNLLGRIGDVTIQRVMPKQDPPKTDSNSDSLVSLSTSSPSVELDLSTKNRISLDNREDEGGGSSVATRQNLNFPGAINEDNEDESEDMDDEDDEQDVPLSLVTTKRRLDESISIKPLKPIISDSIKDNTGSGSNRMSVPVEQQQFNNDKQINYDDHQSTSSKKELVKQSTDFDEDMDNDDDIPLSRLIDPENIGSFDAEGESEAEEDKFSASGDKPADKEEDEDDELDADEDLEDPEEEQEEEPENLNIKTEVQEEDQEEPGSEGGEDDPDREMIVVKQEPLDGCDDDSNAKRKTEETDEDGTEDKAAKKTKKGSGDESGSDSDPESKSNSEKKLLNLRKNIREVMDENQLDEATLAAQRQELERLRRVQEQQRIIREVNRQINLNRQNNAVISLLQGGGTSLLKSSPPGASASPKSTSPNTVLVKLSSGSGPPQVVNKKVLEILRSTKSAANTSNSSKAAALANKLLNKPQSLTPSVSIAPVKPGLTITKLGKGEEEKAAAVAVRRTSGKTKQKGKDDLVTISSSSDDDDCILISEGEEEEEEEEEDATNSGMHTNDLYNVPDDQGRVVINMGRPENEPEVFLAPQIARIIKPHQIGGVRFLFDNVVESLERFKTSPGFGCILAHSMGLGKTLQVVSFCDVFLRYTDAKTVLCIMPINTLQNWLAEFNMWLPVDPSTSPFSSQGDVQPRTFPLFVLNDMQKSMVARGKIVTQWAKEGGVLLIGYELYRQLSLQKPRKRRTVNPKRKSYSEDDIDDEKYKLLLEEMHSALVKPGPDLVICDEGHRIKNSHASISNALKQIRSKRRVVLTGYPLQNNLLEYWCMVDFVRPNYLGTKTEFSNMFERPIQNGQCIDSTPQDIKLMRYRAHVLHSLLEGFVQRRSHSVLTSALPQKEEYVILVRMTAFQRTLYDTFMNEVVRTKAVPNPLKAFAVCCKIWNHPDVLYHFLKRRNMGSEVVDLDLEETAGALVPLTPGNPVAPVLPVKRGRGRSPKGTSPVKRERKVNPRKRGGVEPDSPVKNPMVAAVMPNTTNSNQHSAEPGSMLSHPSGSGLAQLPQSEVKPLPNMQSSFPQQAGQNQFRPNYPFQPNNSSFPSQYPGVNSNYPNFNPPQQNDFHGMPPSYPGFQNHQGFSNQNQYSGFGGNYYSSHQDPSFNGGNYWNNPYFNNDHNNTGMFQNFNDSDPNSSNFYNQDMIGSDGFNAGHRGGYNSGMNMNRPGMSGMNPMHNRMGMNNSHGMMGSTPSMPGINSMGMPMSNMNPNSMNQNSFGLSSVNPVGQGMNMSPNMGMASQYQGMGLNQASGIGSLSSQDHGEMNIPSTQSHIGVNSQTMSTMSMSGMNQVSQGNISQHSGPSIQSTSSGSMHLTNSQVNLMNNTSSHSAIEIQQEAAIQNIANNLMMSTQQLGSGNTLNSPQPNSIPSTHNPEQLRGNPQNMMGPQHDSQEVHRDHSLSAIGNPQGVQNSPQNPMGRVNNQLGSLQEGSQSQGNPGGSQNSIVASNQSNSASSTQGSHMMANMLSSSQSTRNVSSHHNPVGMSTSHDSLSMMSNPQSMLGNQPNPEQNQQSYHGNQPNPSGMFGHIQNPMYRSQQPNQSMFSHQNLPAIGSHQGMFGGSSQQMHHGNPQTPMMNQHMMTNQHSGSSVSSFDPMGSQNILSSQVGPNQSIMHSSQNQNIPQGQDSNMASGNSLRSNIVVQQSLESLSGNRQGCQDNAPSQNMFGNQSTSNPMGNLQNMLSSQSIMQEKPHTDLSSNHQSLTATNQNTPHQQSVSGNQSTMINQHGGLNESAVVGQRMLPNQQLNSSNLSLNPLSDSNQPNMFGMNPNQPSYMNNPNMMGHGSGNNLAMNNQPLGSSQNMGLMMNNSSGLYGNQMNSQDMMGSSTMGNQMNNPPFNSNQMGPGSNMGPYNQPGMMGYSGMMGGNQMNSFGMTNQQSMNNPTLHSQNQPYGNNMMGQPSAMMGVRHPQTSSGFNPELNPGMMGNNFSSTQSNFGMFGNTNNIQSESFNQNNPNFKESSASFPSSSTVSNNRFMSGGEFQSTNSQSTPQDHGNLSQNSFNNDFGNFGLNSNDTKMWDDITNKCVEKPNPVTIKSETDGRVCGEIGLRMEHEKSSQDSNIKPEDVKSPNQIIKPYLEDEIGCEKKEFEEGNKEETKSPKDEVEEGESKESEEKKGIVSTTTPPIIKANASSREDAGIPYDWATELLKGYVPGNIEASAKMALFFCILEESMLLGDRTLVFSQSLFTLNLIEDFLQKNDLPGRQEKWARNWNYYRLDGSTSALEREKLINEFNSNPNIHLFLVSTRAGSLGINLVGANRVVVLDASWNPCHDTQAVCRVYRYGQRKPCFVYRLVTDNCLEKKIYDRQVNKQGMADRVVDECNPDAHLSIKEVTNLCWDTEGDSDVKEFSDIKDKFIDVVMQKMLEKYSNFLSKEPFQHESLLVDRKEKKLSSAEKRLAKRSYELEKQANINNTRPTYGYYPGNTSGVGRGNPLMKPMASVRPMQSELNNQLIRDASSGRPRQWIPAEVWQKQGMSAQEMTLPLDVVIPTNSPERSSIVLKAGQKVMVLKSPKGIYMQLENGKIIAIRTAFKVGKDKKATGVKTESTTGIKKMVVQPTRQRAPASLLPLRNNSNISIIPRGSAAGPRGPKPLMRMMGGRGGKQPVATARPYFGEGSPVTVTVTKKKVLGGSQQASTSTAQVEIRREPKQVTVTPIPAPSPKTSEEASTNRLLPDAEPAEDKTESASESNLQRDQPPVDRTETEVECSVEIKPVKVVSTSKTGKHKTDNNVDEKSTEQHETVGFSKTDMKLPKSLTRRQSRKISVEERAKMDSSLQPVVSLKNYRHGAFQNNKTLNAKENAGKTRDNSSVSKVTVNPLPFKTGSSLSISAVTSKSSSKKVELPLPTNSISIQPVKLPSSTSVNLVKPHSSFTVTPLAEAEKKLDEPKEPSMSITKITEKPESTIFPTTPLGTSVVPSLTVTPTQNLETPVTETPSPHQSSPSSVTVFSAAEVPKTNLPVQPSPPTVSASPQLSSLNPAIDYSFRPVQQQLPSSHTDFFPGFPRPPLGFPTGNFFPPRKDASGKDLPSSLAQFPTFDAANYLSPNPFSAAAASSNFPNMGTASSPFASPAGMVPPPPQTAFDSDFARMYSAFHRPEPQSTAPAFSTQASIPPTQFNPYSYSPFLMHSGFPLPSTNNQPNTTPNASTNPSTQ